MLVFLLLVFSPLLFFIYNAAFVVVLGMVLLHRFVSVAARGRAEVDRG